MNQSAADLDPARLRALHEGGASQRELAELFGVSQSTVARRLRELPAVEGRGDLEQAASEYVAGLDVDADRALLGRVLVLMGRKLDQVGASARVGSAQAAPGLARQFAELVEAIGDRDPGDVAERVAKSLSWLRAERERAA